MAAIERLPANAAVLLTPVRRRGRLEARQALAGGISAITFAEGIPTEIVIGGEGG
ncbi:MAG TPA: hypothetical protein VMJ65_02620 [Solirubrobacteraceae bacterium]|nr:hypothetical protein [Solirubrobacteraceae bacterium]